MRMKICIEISNKHLMAAYGMLMASSTNDEEEQRLEEAVESLKVSTEPVKLDIKEIADGEQSAAVALVLALSAISKKMK